MARRIRSFGGKNYRLLKQIPHFDSKGRNRTPIQTKRAAETWAELYRSKGYNARVVNWVGGSGIFIGNRAIRIYNKTQDEARTEWMEEIEQNDYNSAAFGIGQSFSTSAQAGDAVPSATHAFRLPLETPNISAIDFLHPTSQSTLDDALLETETIPVHVAEPRGSRSSYVAMSMMGEMIDEVGAGQIGWGSGPLPEKRMPLHISDKRSRFRVVLVFEQPDGMGERPSFAFATKETAELFANKLKQLIENNGYYREGGKIQMASDVSYESPVWIIPSDKISVDIVQEDSGYAQSASDQARSQPQQGQVFPFGGQHKATKTWNKEDME